MKLFSLTAAVKSNGETPILSIVYHICIGEVSGSTTCTFAETQTVFISLSEPRDNASRQYVARHDVTSPDRAEQ